MNRLQAAADKVATERAEYERVLTMFVGSIGNWTQQQGGEFATRLQAMARMVDMARDEYLAEWLRLYREREQAAEARVEKIQEAATAANNGTRWATWAIAALTGVLLGMTGYSIYRDVSREPPVPAINICIGSRPLWGHD